MFLENDEYLELERVLIDVDIQFVEIMIDTVNKVLTNSELCCNRMIILVIELRKCISYSFSVILLTKF